MLWSKTVLHNKWKFISGFLYGHGCLKNCLDNLLITMEGFYHCICGLLLWLFCQHSIPYVPGYMISYDWATRNFFISSKILTYYCDLTVKTKHGFIILGVPKNATPLRLAWPLINFDTALEVSIPNFQELYETCFTQK